MSRIVFVKKNQTNHALIPRQTCIPSEAYCCDRLTASLERLHSKLWNNKILVTLMKEPRAPILCLNPFFSLTRSTFEPGGRQASSLHFSCRCLNLRHMNPDRGCQINAINVQAANTETALNRRARLLFMCTPYGPDLIISPNLMRS